MRGVVARPGYYIYIYTLYSVVVKVTIQVSTTALHSPASEGLCRVRRVIRLLLMDHIVFYTPLSLFFSSSSFFFFFSIHTLCAHQRNNNTTYDCISILIHQRERESARCRCSHVADPSPLPHKRNVRWMDGNHVFQSTLGMLLFGPEYRRNITQLSVI